MSRLSLFSWQNEGKTRAWQRVFFPVLLLAALAFVNSKAGAQSQPAAPDAQQAPEAGGPQGDVGPYSMPKKKEEPPPEKPRPIHNPPEVGNFSITKDVSLVTIPVSLVTDKGMFVPGLKQENFKIFEDGVQQKITGFNVAQAPITAVLLVEFASTNYYFVMDALRGSASFAQSLKPEDWIAVISYDMHTHLLNDFTQNKEEVYRSIRNLGIPGFRETNEFDALYDTLDRLERVEGRKYIILISSGVDTFSRLTYDKVLKQIHDSKDIAIYTISTGQAYRIVNEGRTFGTMANMTYLQADNQMRTFSKMTGGQSYFPRFAAEFPEIFEDIGRNIRNQYLLAYHPTNPNLDGTYRKLKIEVVDPQSGAPLLVRDQKNKTLKYTIVAREGYTAKHTVE